MHVVHTWYIDSKVEQFHHAVRLSILDISSDCCARSRRKQWTGSARDRIWTTRHVDWQTNGSLWTRYKLNPFTSIARHAALIQNPKTSGEIQRLRDEGSEKELLDLLGSRMPFGTAGLRAKMGAGYCRMNDLTVIQTAQVSCTCIYTYIMIL